MGGVILGIFMLLHDSVFGSLALALPHSLSLLGIAPAVYVTQTDTPGMIKLTLVVPYEAKEPGYAHYVEHLTWLAAIQGRLASSAPDNNAFTTQDVIMYELAGPQSRLDDMLSSLKRTLEPLAVPRRKADAERNVILREYDFRVVGNPSRQASDVLDAYLYEGGTGGISVLGNPDDIRALSYDKAKALHDATHGPGKAILIASGDTTPEDVADALVRTGFPALALRANIAAHHLKEPGRGKMTVYLSMPQGTRPRMVWRGLANLDLPVSYDLLVVECGLLGDVLSSALAGGIDNELRYNRRLAEGLSIEVIPLDERHVEMRIWAEPDRGVSFDLLASGLDGAVSRLLRGIPPASYERVLRRFRRDLEEENGSPKTRAEVIASRLTELRVPPPPDNAKRLSPELSLLDINILAAALSRTQRVAVVYMGKDVPP